MLFNSVAFLLYFFPIVTVLFFLLPHRHRWALLLLASCYFYMALVPKYILILGAIILVDFVAGLLIASSSGPRRRTLLFVSLAVNVGVLAVFKYFNFASENLVRLLTSFGVEASPMVLHWVLPIGLSFHTFQSMSYTIEVYRGSQEPERHLGYYALYVMFYPQLVAGPIERPQNLIHQFHETKVFEYERVKMGLQLMLWGLFKKCFVSDALAVYVDRVYDAPTAHAHAPLALLVATYFFTFQIYCDFSGYSDIARGAARVMGYELMVNFDFPYTAQSIPEFWRRWHISLSTWFRDYVYFPLGGGRVSPARKAGNIATVFLVSGFWHGAGWNFGAWGAAHALLMVIGEFLYPLRRLLTLFGVAPEGLPAVLIRRIVTFHLVAATWVFFRANALSDAMTVFHGVLTFNWGIPLAARGLAADVDVKAGIFSIFSLLLAERAYRSGMLSSELGRFGEFRLRASHLFYASILFALILGAPLEDRAFIYFQF